MSSVMLMLLPFSIPPFLFKKTSAGHNHTVRKIRPKNILSVLEVFKSNNNRLAATYFWSSVHSGNLEVGVQDVIFAFVFKSIVGNSDSTRWSNQVRRLKWNENNLWHGNVPPQTETNSDEFRHLKSCNPCFLMFYLGFYLLMCIIQSIFYSVLFWSYSVFPTFVYVSQFVIHAYHSHHLRVLEVILSPFEAISAVSPSFRWQFRRRWDCSAYSPRSRTFSHWFRPPCKIQIHTWSQKIAWSSMKIVIGSCYFQTSLWWISLFMME